jgi:hypothetical protein
VTDEQLAERARELGLPIDAGRAAGFRPGLESLLARTRRLGELLPRETAPPPSPVPR